MNDIKQYCILIVDDEVHNIDVLCQILSPLYSVKIAKNGTSAIHMAEKHSPDLILLDVIMPDMSGFEVLTKLKQTDMTRNIPVIFITGLDSIQDEEKGLLLGAVDYIIKPFHNAIVKLRVSTHLKIVEQIRMIERLGMLDALTDIPNRRSFDHQLGIELGRSARDKTPISMLMIDIDLFKSFNDNYGHSHGDACLKTVAGVISQSLKRSSDFAARWGGEEFTVLLPNTDICGAIEVAEQIRAGVETAVITHVDGRATNVTVSIGVHSAILDTHSSYDDFIIKADNALYAAKDAGRNKVISSVV